MAIRALGPLRHQCLACGGSCQGVAVRVWDAAERRAVIDGARQLGVTRPLDGDHLRREQGRCVFLGPDRRCRLHAVAGADAKPRVCRQFPRVVVQTEDEVRAGVDPGCYTAFASWRAGPQVALPPGMLTADVRYGERERRAETALLAVCGQEGASIASVAAAMCAPGPSEGGLPAGFAARLLALVRRAALHETLEHPDLGDAVRGVLTPVLAHATALDPAAPPAWAPAPEVDAWAVETTRRMVFLRLAPEVPRVELTAMAMVVGAVLCGWANPDPVAFGPALAGFARMARAGVFWTRLFPGPEALTWLATGR